MKFDRTLIFLSLFLLLAAGAALYSVFRVTSFTSPVKQAIQKTSMVNPSPQSPVLWRIPISTTANKPTPLPSGWLVTDRKGLIISFTCEGAVRWQTSYSNYSWQASSVVDGETICAVTQNGELVLFEMNSGVAKWSKKTDIMCQHPPLVEMLNQQRVIILLSQEDGTLVCLNALDGSIRWRSPATTRSDGPPARFGEFIGYGNCDAAVYLFSIADGQLKGSVQLEGDEQLAGGLLPLSNGDLIVVGTRNGKLAVLSTTKRTCVSRASVSESEAFATPVLIEPKRILMPTPEGRMTFWKIEGDQLVPDNVITLSSQFDETVVANNVLWAIGNRSVYAVCITDLSKQLQYTTLGDDLRAIAPGVCGKTVLISDGELICVKGF